VGQDIETSLVATRHQLSRIATCPSRTPVISIDRFRCTGSNTLYLYPCAAADLPSSTHPSAESVDSTALAAAVSKITPPPAALLPPAPAASPSPRKHARLRAVGKLKVPVQLSLLPVPLLFPEHDSTHDFVAASSGSRWASKCCKMSTCEVVRRARVGHGARGFERSKCRSRIRIKQAND
jgi:hypothetical protein